MFARGGLIALFSRIARIMQLQNWKNWELDCIITQNVDNLHQAAGNSPDKIFELHGNMKRVKCLDCESVFPIEDLSLHLPLEKLPQCKSCNGIVKPDVVLFGEQLMLTSCRKLLFIRVIATCSSLSALRWSYIPLHTC